MEKSILNYQYRYPRVMFANGDTKYGILYGIYNKAIKKLEYYFADSTQIRKSTNPNKHLSYSWVKQLKNKINPVEILKVEYLN
jgi:hypothetical protein